MMRHAATVLALALLSLPACGKREAEPAGGSAAPALPAVEAAIVAEQAPWYSATACAVCGGALDARGGAKDLVEDGKLVRVCSEECGRRFLGSPAPFVAARDSLLIAAQLASYPTDSCVVMQDVLDVMGTPRDFVFGARLIRVCCDTCEERFLADPSPFLAMLDAKAKSPDRKPYLSRS
jgi:hypothetical protein